MAAATELFISEYIEGSSNNKALEIFNGTGSAINLAEDNYKIEVYFNGSATAGLSIALNGSVAANDVFVLAQSSANAAILAQADQTNGSGWFNGDDALVLTKGGVIIDVIGQIGLDPGAEWGTGLVSTADNTLQRKAAVTAGDPAGSDPFDPSAQWDGLAADTFSGLGSHAITSGEPAFTISALTADKAEGNGGTIDFTFTVSREAAGTPGSVGWTLSGLGGAGEAELSDFAGATSGTVSFAADETQKTVMVSINGDVAAEGPESFRVALSGAGAPSATGVIRDDDTPATQIADIQGAAHRSPMEGQFVSTVGIVTAKTSNGFWIQDQTPDSNVATSDGVFVFTNSAPAANIVAGAEVRVWGTVTEFFPNSSSTTELSLTEISIGSSGGIQLTGATGSVAATVVGADGRLPPSEVIDDDGLQSFDAASDGADFWESLEGMLVELKAAKAVGPSFTNSFNDSEVFVTVDNGADAGQQTPSGGLIVQPGDFNPEKIAVQEDDRAFNNDFAANVGDRLGDVTGVVNYDSRSNYEVLVTKPFEVTSGGLQKEAATSLAAGDADHLTVASYNAENLAASDAAGRFQTIAAEVVGKLKSPDIIALQEIQDDNGETNNGVVSSDATIAKLVDAIASAGGPTYKAAYVTPQNNEDGGAPGGNIRQVFLYNAARVQLADAAPTIGDFNDSNTAQLDDGIVDLGLTVGRLDPTNVAFEDSRKPLAAEFVFNGEVVVLVNNHFNSKGGDDPLYGVNQPPVAVTQAQREAQAEVVADFVEQLYGLDEDVNVVVLGDLNDFSFSSPLQRLEDAGLGDLSDLLPANQRYDYVFDGNSQDLDHILASDNLGQGAAFDVLRINAEFWDQTSDHDPLIARLNIARGETLSGGAGTDTLTGGVGNDSLAGGNGDDTLSGGDGKDSLTGDNGDDSLAGGAGMDSLSGGGGGDTLLGGAGSDLLAGGSGADLMSGGDGRDTMVGESGDDSLIGGAGDDLLMGGSGGDRFVFDSAAGDDRVADFNGADVIRFIGTGFSSLANVLAATVDTAEGALITIDDDASLLLAGVGGASLNAGDFLFA